MVRTTALVVLGSALVGMSRGAALGTAEEYASGAVHARIMEIKMVCDSSFQMVGLWFYANAFARHNGMLKLLPVKWIAHGIPSSPTLRVRMDSPLPSLETPTIPSGAIT